MNTGRCFDGEGWASATRLQKMRFDGPWLVTFQPPLIGPGNGPQAGNTGVSPSIVARHGLLPVLQRPTANARRTARFSAADATSWPELRAEVLIEALAAAQTEIELFNRPINRLKSRIGLQVTGVRITGEVLRLANAQFDFSLRLINCLIEVPIVISNARLITLDLSGSAIAGLDASFLKAAGSVRLRRSCVAGPADFAGASVHGYFDASEAVFKPLLEKLECQGFDADRGMLNLSQASIDNDVHLDRATIWGGLAMRGLNTKRSLFLDEAVVLAPMAMLEALAQVAASPGQALFCPGLARPEFPLRPYAKPDPQNRRADQAIDALKFGCDRLRALAGDESSVFCRLLTQSMRARTSAIRGDGLVVGGSLFAHALLANGRVRFKYARIGGSLTLRHARLRSIEAVRRTFDDLANWPAWGEAIEAFATTRLQTYSTLVSAQHFQDDDLAPGGDGNALDLRECRVEGNVNLGNDDDDPSSPTTIDGLVRADRGHFDGEFVARRVRWNWTARVRIAREPGDFGHQVAGYASKRYFAAKTLLDDLHAGRQHQLVLANASIKDNLLLQNSSELGGLDVGNAVIGGDLLFCNYVEAIGEAPPNPTAATGTYGEIRLEGAEIAGDCHLPFCAARGPSISARFLIVKERLAILFPSTASLRFCDFMVLREQAGDVQTMLRRAAFKDEWAKERSKRRTENRFVDLRNATAGQFMHPPSAWPLMGLLHVHGFAYRRGHELGPLAPHPFGHRVARHEAPARRRTARRRDLVFTLLMVAIGLPLALFAVTNGFGAVSFGSIVLEAATFLGLISLTLYIFLPLLDGPKGLETEPMAIDWLRLQGHAINRYRGPRMLQSRLTRLTGKPPDMGNIYHALEPYTVAVKALREEGLWISANKVERERLMVRAGQLSWRLHAVQKSFYKLVDWFSGYGFKPARLMFANGFLVVFAAWLVSLANKSDAIVPDAKGHAAMTEAQALTYAADLVIPAFGFGGMEGWKQSVDPGHDGWLLWLSLVHVLGLVLASVLVAALVARVSAVISRFAD